MMEMAVMNTFFQQRQEHRVTYKRGANTWTTSCVHNVKEIGDCKVVVGESVAREQRIMVCKMAVVVKRTKKTKAEQRTQW